MQRWLAIVDVPFGRYTDQIVSIKVNRIGARRINIADTEPAHWPWSRPQESLARSVRKGILDTVILNANTRQYLLGEGTANDFKFLAVSHRLHFS